MGGGGRDHPGHGPRPADHRITGTTAAGERWRLVALPFLSQRYAVRAVEMFQLSAAEANQTYADHLARLLAALTEDFAADGVINLITTHLTVVGGTTGGGERQAHTIQAYAVPATVFPASTHYVALGHLHRAQTVPGPAPVHYCGSPLAVDFGESANTPSVTLVEVAAGGTAQLRQVPITSAVPLRTVRGTVAELAAREPDEAWLRVSDRATPGGVAGGGAGAVAAGAGGAGGSGAAAAEHPGGGESGPGWPLPHRAVQRVPQCQGA